ncbi:hypothetical protein MNEG_2437, partial [Monoraphidium neglectum]
IGAGVVSRQDSCGHKAARHLPPAELISSFMNDRCGNVCAAGSCPYAADPRAVIGI